MDQNIDAHAGEEYAVYVKRVLVSVDVSLREAKHNVNQGYSAHFIENL